MGLFKKQNEVKQKQGFNVYSLITSLATVILFVAVGLIVLGFREVIPFSSPFLLVLLTMFIVSGAALLALPWVRRLQFKQHQIVSWVFIGLLILCAAFWLICGFLLIINFSKLTSDAAGVINILNFLKFTLVYTMNYSIASLIATNVIKYGKQMIPFQIILYLSNLIVDLYFTYILVFCIHFNQETFIEFNLEGLRWLINPIVVTIILIALIYMIIANAIAKRIERRRERYAKSADEMPGEMFGERTIKKPVTAQEKLAELKAMLDQNLISQEEYDIKKNEILKNL